MAKKGADPNQEKYQKALTVIVRKVHHTKKAKDHTKPKIPMNSYICFNKKNRENFSAMHPDLPATELTKIMSREWKKLKEAAKTDPEKQKELDEYTRMSKEDTDMEKWQENNPQKKQKGPVNGYHIFGREKSEEASSMMDPDDKSSKLTMLLDMWNEIKDLHLSKITQVSE